MDIKKVIAQMTLEEKAGLCSGLDFWHTKPVERLGVSSCMVSDGPHGLRKQAQGADSPDESIKAVCFPAGCATAASFDRALIRRLGETLGDECQHEGVGVLLGPAVNIKRSPLCGRNFEYYSEDPFLAGEMAATYISGLQSRGVGASIKHFAANSQEHRRMSSSSEADERTLREIYLAAFEAPVRRSRPWTVMCSYNRINGVYSSENPWLLNEVLRDEWGFDGYVMTDWGAVVDRVKGLKAGVDLEMPASGGVNDKHIVDAVRAGELDEALVDQACERILSIGQRYLETASPETPWDLETDHALSAEMAAECMVLLKNEGDILPLRKNEKVAFIGDFAGKPRFQGGGSSHINCYKTTSALDAAEGLEVIYAKGFDADADRTTDEWLAEAAKAAQAARVAVVFAGLPDAYESEGYDRIHMRLPECQNALIEAVALANPNTVVVLHNGSPVEMPWAGRVKGILEAYLGGQAVGLATVRVLFGDVNPSGRLPETFPLRMEDNPSYPFYGGEGDIAEYREGVFVGYRWYDKKKMEVLYPFGYGLSYTEFEYSNLELNRARMKDTGTLTVSADVTNTGIVSGKEVVQLYVAAAESAIIRPVRELKGFVKVELEPGETKRVTFTLGKRAFAYWNRGMHDWHVETGEYEIGIGRHSRDIVLSERVTVESTQELPVRFDMNSVVADIVKDPARRELMLPYIRVIAATFTPEDDASAHGEAISGDMAEAMLRYMPLRAALSFGRGQFSAEDLQGLIDRLNAMA